MIVVYVEEWPDNTPATARPIGSMALTKTYRAPDMLLDTYQLEIDEAPNQIRGVDQLQQRTIVYGVNSKQSVWKLIRRAIDAAFPSLVS